jgi:hypothetical protein
MNVINILSDTSRQEWKDMSYDYFIKYVVEPLNMMGTPGREKIVASLDYPQFELLTMKCFEEQDRQPTEETYEDEEKYEEAYYDTLPILLLLEDLLSIRIVMENDSNRILDLTKKKGIVELFLKPHLFDDIANKINEKRKK